MYTQQFSLLSFNLKSIDTQHNRALRIKFNNKELKDYVFFKKRAAGFRVFNEFKDFFKDVKTISSI